MTVKLAVAGAFHTSYMQPAQERLQCVYMHALVILNVAIVASCPCALLAVHHVCATNRLLAVAGQ